MREGYKLLKKFSHINTKRVQKALFFECIVVGLQQCERKHRRNENCACDSCRDSKGCIKLFDNNYTAIHQ